MKAPHRKTLGWERPVDSSGERADDPWEGRPPLFERGEVISSRYEVRELIGEGAMGQVFDAHEYDLNRRVAIKAGFPHIDPAFLRREAQGLAAIRHPGVTTVYSWGEHRGITYFVMEKLLGVTLAAHLAKRRAEGVTVSLSEVIELLVSLADVLATVHHAGIAHRDVKPANVVLAVGGRTVLTDFGVVIEERTVAHDGPKVGTAEYMAPETIRGDVHAGLGFLVDVYAFGVIAFELLTGAAPFRSEGGVEGLFAQHLDAPPPLDALSPDTPPVLRTLLGELLAKDPLDRPQSMESVAARLRTLAARRSAAPKPPTPSQRPPPKPSRPPR